MEEKQEFILHWKSGKYTISNLAEMFGISRPTAYKYIKKKTSKVGSSKITGTFRRPITRTATTSNLNNKSYTKT